MCRVNIVYTHPERRHSLFLSFVRLICSRRLIKKKNNNPDEITRFVVFTGAANLFTYFNTILCMYGAYRNIDEQTIEKLISGINCFFFILISRPDIL